MSDSVSNLIDTLVGAVMFAVAISLLLYLNTQYTHMIAYTARQIDEKQSIGIAGEDKSIDTTPDNRNEILYTKAQVLSTILTVDENATDVSVQAGGAAASGTRVLIPKDVITAAKTGDERAIRNILQRLYTSEYTIQHIYATDEKKGDYLYELRIETVT